MTDTMSGEERAALRTAAREQDIAPSGVLEGVAVPPLGELIGGNGWRGRYVRGDREAVFACAAHPELEAAGWWLAEVIGWLPQEAA